MMRQLRPHWARRGGQCGVRLSTFTHRIDHDIDYHLDLILDNPESYINNDHATTSPSLGTTDRSVRWGIKHVNMYTWTDHDLDHDLLYNRSRSRPSTVDRTPAAFMQRLCPQWERWGGQCCAIEIVWVAVAF